MNEGGKNIDALK